jgi:hypothetical protein
MFIQNRFCGLEDETFRWTLLNAHFMLTTLRREHKTTFVFGTTSFCVLNVSPSQGEGRRQEQLLCSVVLARYATTSSSFTLQNGVSRILKPKMVIIPDLEGRQLERLDSFCSTFVG